MEGQWITNGDSEQVCGPKASFDTPPKSQQKKTNLKPRLQEKLEPPVDKYYQHLLRI